MKSSNNIKYSRTLPQDIKTILLSYSETIKVSGEADFYGSSLMLAKKLGVDKLPRSFSSWSHGWEVGELKFTEQILWSYHWHLYRLVRNNRVANFLLERDVKNVLAVGLPIIYTNSQVSSRKAGSILFMPAHSMSYMDINPDVVEMVSQAKSLMSLGHYVCFCVHADCVKHGKTIPLLDENSIDWFTGSAVNDINSLQRMRNIFDFFETVLSNSIGSHFLYSQLFGAKFAFIEPFFEYTFSQLEKDPFCSSKPELTKHLVKQASLSITKANYPEYFNGYENAVCNKNFAEIECGVPDRVSPEKLASLLGWESDKQLLCPLLYFSSKLSAKFSNLIGGR